MTTKSKRITYNVHDRGRKHLGQDRIFDLKKLERLVNSPAVQEMVAAGDMLGYYGHWPRLVFGMKTREGGIVDGKVVALEHAVRTTFLSCDGDGNITHENEFLDTPSGRVAAQLYESGAGGFSSAIDAAPGSNPYIPTAFYAMDFVLEPNYSTNRRDAVLLDAVAAQGAELDAMAILDSVVAESSETTAVMSSLLDSLGTQHTMALETMEHMEATIQRLTRDQDILIGKLAARGVADPVGLLDDVGHAPVKTGTRTIDFGAFSDATLQPLQVLKEEGDDNSPEGRVVRDWGMAS